MKVAMTENGQFSFTGKHTRAEVLFLFPGKRFILASAGSRV
jgi:hypothetical protein